MNNAGKNMYEKLTIRDKFMFGKVTKNPVIAQKMADLLTPVEMGEGKGVEREKFLQHRSSSKYVKLDMYLEDENGRVVDTEMQNKSQNRVVQEELPLRVRYYQGMIDQEILSSGTDADLSEAPEGIREFLNYVQTETFEDDFTSQLDKEIKQARLNEEWRLTIKSQALK